MSEATKPEWRALRIAGEFSARCTHLIDAGTQNGVASIQRRFDGPYTEPTDVLRYRGDKFHLWTDGANVVISIQTSALTLADIIQGIEAIGRHLNVDYGFIMTPIQVTDLSRALD
jgi:hypothetical protein